MAHLADRVARMLRIREEVLKQHPTLCEMLGSEDDEYRGEKILAQYTLAACVLEVDDSICSQSQAGRV